MAETAPTGCANADADGAHNAAPPLTNREDVDADLDELLDEDDSGDVQPPAEKPSAQTAGSVGIDTDDTPDTSTGSTAIEPKPKVMNDDSVPAVSAQPIKESRRTEDTPASAVEVSGIAAPGGEKVISTNKATADTDISTSNTSPSATEEEDGGWGLSSVTAALGGGWGFAAGADPVASATGTEEEQQDDEWKHQAETIEEAAAAAVAAASSFFSGTAVTSTASTEETAAAPAREAKEDEEWKEKAESVEHVVEDAAAAAAAAASSFFSGATEYLTGSATAEAEAEAAAAAAAAPETTTASTTSTDPTAAALRSLADLNPMSKLASGWIDDLEKQNAESDPHRKLRDHLDGHLGEWPRSSYEEWVEEALRVLDGWDDGSAVVDDTFYMEDSVHRNIWNERNAEDDDGVECKREYVSARKPSTDGSGSSAIKAVPKTMDKKKTAAVVISGDSEDADLAGLIGDEEEIVFVDAPKSG